jgi:hypothetical protein
MTVELSYDGSLEELFALLDRLWYSGAAEGPQRVRRLAAASQGDLFEAASSPEEPPPPTILPDPAVLEGAAALLFQVSVDAYDALVYAWMSELPIEAPAIRYALRVLSAAAAAAGQSAPWFTGEEARRGAAIAANDRGNEDCRTVLAACYKVTHEIDRLRGFLRFSPDVSSHPGMPVRYIARCAPDHNILPALASHFARRFGDTPWAIIDEKRGLVLSQEESGEIRLFNQTREPWAQKPVAQGPWEDLWRSYHQTINIENRKNLALQRQFTPLRYRPYLTEFDGVPEPQDCN